MGSAVEAGAVAPTEAFGFVPLIEPAAIADDDLSSAVTQVRAALRQPGSPAAPPAAPAVGLAIPGYPGEPRPLLSGRAARGRPATRAACTRVFRRARTRARTRLRGTSPAPGYPLVVVNPCHQVAPPFGGVPHYPGDPRFGGPQFNGTQQFGGGRQFAGVPGLPVAPGHPSVAQYPSAPVYPGHYPAAPGQHPDAWPTQAPSDLLGVRCGQLVADDAVWGIAAILGWLLLGGLSLGAALLFGQSAPTAYFVLAVVLTVLQFVVLVALNWFFHAYWPSRHGGQTVAMKWLHLRVATFSGTQPSFGALSLRWLLLPVDKFCLIGLFVASNSPLGQRLGDKVANTVVVRAE